eukprot:2497065-Amphidinium_carterae.1
MPTTTNNNNNNAMTLAKTNHWRFKCAHLRTTYAYARWKSVSKLHDVRERMAAVPCIVHASVSKESKGLGVVRSAT